MPRLEPLVLGHRSPRSLAAARTTRCYVWYETQTCRMRPKTSGAIISELHKRGHTSIGHSHLSAALASLTKKEVLKRNKNAEEVWAYENGPKNE